VKEDERVLKLLSPHPCPSPQGEGFIFGLKGLQPFIASGYVLVFEPNCFHLHPLFVLSPYKQYPLQIPRKDISLSPPIIVPLFYRGIWDFVAADIDYLDNADMY
jgi:hypothetical protein